MSKLQFTKVREVKSPQRGTPLSAGIDFFVPNIGIVGAAGHVLFPGEGVNIPSGIKLRIPKGYALVMKNKSGVAVKKGLQVGACVIDEDYQGEVHLHVRNIGQDIVTILPGEKLMQGLLIPVLYAELQEIATEPELFEGMESERGAGGFGSTGL